VRGARAPAGFTLLEVLVAVAILGLGVTSVLELIGASARAAARTRAMTGALFVAEELMEEMASLSESELRARGREAGDYAERAARLAGRSRLLGVRSPAEEGPRYAYDLEVTPDGVDPGLYRLDVSVAWPDPGGGRVELTTLRRFASPELAAERMP
jgi:type II secretion system protein I